MAIIGKIRRNNWLLISLIGLGLLAFIMMDSMSGDKSIGATSGTTIGNIAGTKISYPEFNRLYEVRSKNFDSNDSYGQRNYIWDFLVEKSILKSEASDLGLGVSSQELRDLQFGPASGLSPLMAQRFPVAGGQPFGPQQADLAKIQQFKATIDGGEYTPDFKDFWEMHESEVRNDRIKTKLNNLVSKSLYTPNWMVEKAYTDQNQRITFEYVKIPFDEIDDSQVTVEDADLNSYLTANAAKYAQDEETRKVGFVAFDVVPSASDSSDVRKKVAKLGQEFAEKTTGEDDSLFVESNYGQFDPRWLSTEMITSPSIKESVFTLPIGSVTQPYLEGRAYRVAKILDRRILPDSAKCRHILIGDQQFIQAQRSNPQLKLNSAQYRVFKKTADSLINILENEGGNFDSLTLKHTADRSSANTGGIIDWTYTENSLVPEFSDAMFFNGELNKLVAVKTQFGYHIIEPLGRKNITNTERVRVAYLSENITPTKQTRQAVRSEANQFIRDNKTLEALKAAAEANSNLTYSSSTPLKANDYNIVGLGGTEDSRKMVKFAFDSEVGDVSPVLYTFQDQIDFYDNKYVVAGVETIQAAGNPSLASVRETIAPIVRNMKKGEVIKGKINNTQDLSAVASMFSSQVDTATNVSFTAPTVQGLGQEPKVVAAAFGLNANGVSQPIVGENGVYIVKTTAKPEVGTPSNIAAIRKTIRQASQNQVTTAVIQSLKKNADITDKRSKFF